MKYQLVPICLLLAACTKEPVTERISCPDPVAGCRIDMMELRFSRQPSVMQTFDLDLLAPESTQPYASFQMQGMDMGPNRYRLLRESGKWHAQVMLPACVQGRRDWILALEIGDKVYEVPFTSG